MNFTRSNRARDLQAEIHQLGPWFHNLHLPGGIQTAPDHHFGDFPRCKWQEIAPHIPDDLSGWRALDIGCNAGFYSFELAARGASVVGIDTGEHYLRQAQWAKEILGEDKVEFRHGSVYDADRLGHFDLVVFMGVLYHLRHPLLALDLLGDIAPQLLIFQTLTQGGMDVAHDARQDIDFQHRERLNDPTWPNMAFIETTFCNDPTNWWVPNHAAVEAMLRSAGFRVMERPAHETYLCTADRSHSFWRSEDDPMPRVAEARRRRSGEG